MLPVMRSLPLRVEYRLRLLTMQPNFEFNRNRNDNKVGLTSMILMQLTILTDNIIHGY